MKKLSMLVLLACFIGTVFGAGGTVKVVRPNGGNGWAAGVSKQIRWSHSLKDTSAIELWKGATGSEVKVLTIADTVQRNATATTGYSRYNWTIPSGLTPATDYKVKIVQLKKNGAGVMVPAVVMPAGTVPIVDLSDNHFNIILNPYVKVTAPNGGEELVIGDLINITWQTNTTDSVKILLFKNGAQVLHIKTRLASLGTFAWTIPALAPGNDYKIKVVEYDGIDVGLINDESDDYFYIGPTLAPYTITKPSDPDIIWLRGGTPSTKYITWNHTNSTETATIQYKKGAAAAVDINTTATGSIGSQPFNISGLAVGTDYKVIITGNTTSETDDSDNDFAIYDSLYLTKATLVSNKLNITGATGNVHPLIATAGYLNFQPVQDSTFTIAWNATIPAGDAIQIKLYQGGDYLKTLGEVDQGTQTFVWNVPADQAVGDYSIEIISKTYPELFRDMSKIFTLRSKELKITYPTGGELLMTGIPTLIKYTVTALADDQHIITLENVNTGGAAYSRTINATANTATPGNLTQAFTPLAADVDVANVLAVNLSKFKIKIATTTAANTAKVVETPEFSLGADRVISAVTITASPFYRGKTETSIKWTENFSKEDVVIALFRNGAQIGAPIATVKTNAAPAQRTKLWNIPGDLPEGYTYRIKVWNKNFPTIIDSTANFRIQEAPLRVVYPSASGISLVRGSTYDINWVSGITENVKIELYKDDLLSTPTTLIASALNNNNGLNIDATGDTIANSYKGKYTWTIPKDLAVGNYLIHISGVTTTTTLDVSDNLFAVTAPPNVAVTYPDAAGLVFKKGDDFNITWNRTNFTNKVKIDLMKETGTTVKTYVHSSWITQQTSNAGPFNWKIPTTVTSSGVAANYKIRVQSIGPDSSAVRDTSANAFRIITNPILVVKPNSIGKYGLWTLDSTVTANFTLTADASLSGTLVYEIISPTKGTTDITAALSGTATQITAMKAITPVGARVASFKLPTTVLPATDYKLKISCGGTANDQSDSSFTIQYAWKVAGIEDQDIKEFKLEQNYPNPFNNTTEITYLVPNGYNDNVKVAIYNVKGEIVRNLVNRTHNTGKYAVTFNADSFVSGVYYYAIEGVNFKQVKRMLLLK